MDADGGERMSDYIEREAFIESQQHLYCENCARRKNGKGKFVYDIGDAPCRACGIMDVLDAVADFPAADVRPVVTCGECIYFRLNSCIRWADGTFMERTDFCSRAAEREES